MKRFLFIYCLAILLTLNLSGCGSSMRPMIIAHRGASAEAPENTVRSVQMAWEKDSDAAEIDVYLTRDNRVMALHDDSTKRTTGVDRKIKDTDSKELRTLDAGSWKGIQFSGEKIPFLEEVLATMPKGRMLFVEIKCGPEVLPYVKNIIAESGKSSQIVIIGFDLETMAASKSLMPEFPTYWLRGTVEDKKTHEKKPHNPDWIRMVQEKKLDGLNVHYAGLTPEFAKAVQTSGLKLYAWTVDDPAEAKRLALLNVDGITTNKPDKIGIR